MTRTRCRPGPQPATVFCLLSGFLAWGAVPLASALADEPPQPPRLLLPMADAASLPAGGVWAVWHGPDVEEITSPVLQGGQLFAQWADVEPEAGRYDFSQFERQLERLAGLGLDATLQINANKHPEWLFERVPTIPVNLQSVQNDDRTPMFWHPNYRAAQQRLIRAMADWLAGAEHRESVAAVRHSYNAIGTEHWLVPEQYRDADVWSVPPGVRRGEDWSRPVVVDYVDAVLATYLEAFADGPLVLVRRALLEPEGLLESSARGRDLQASLAGQLLARQIGMFHTSSEVQPRNDGGSAESYRTMFAWCREQRAFCYAESWTDAARSDFDYPQTPTPSEAQWIYWRVLSDLHLGVDMVAVYAGDLARASEPAFGEALALIDRYAGTHHMPERSPGAWIALREGEFTPGDYSFLASSSGDCGEGVAGVGPRDAPYGLWARTLGPGDACTIRFDGQMIEAYRRRGERLTVAVTVLGNGAATGLELSGLVDTRLKVPPVQDWHTLTAAVPDSGPEAEGGDGVLTLEVRGQTLVVHRIELAGDVTGGEDTR